MTTDAPAAEPGTPWSMTPDQASAALAQKSAAYQASLAPVGSVAPPPPGVSATTPAQAAARLAALKSDPNFRSRLLTGSAAQVREFQELTAIMASAGVQSDTLMETIDAVSGDPNTLRRSHYEGLIDGLREGGMNEIAETYIRALDTDPNLPRGSEGDGLAFKAFRDRLMKSPELREKYLNGSSPKLTSLMNALNRVIALAAQDGRPLSAEGREILSELERLG
jgi:hypothetical protein